ncbi:MAG: CRTAC1 family protein [Proteobacteria bacterium]|nr:CRTAC1 family protein [Pseudomonadota bacterium]
MVRPTCWMLVALAGCGSDGPAPNPSCDPPRGPPMARFADVTRASGLDFAYYANGFQGGGLAVVDLDGDDLPDVVAGRREGGLAMFRNRGALQFEEITDAGLDPTLGTTAIAAVDLDNDGDRDLVLVGAGIAHVMANHGDGTFEEVAREGDVGSTEHVLPTDLDGDGLLDLYFSNYDVTAPSRTLNRLYLNRGGLHFEGADVPGAGLSWTATAFDVDADGDQDLYVANDGLLADFGAPSPAASVTWPVDLLLRNDGPGADGVPRFTDVATDLGLADTRSSMGGVLGDFDDDGRLDLYVPNFGAKKLFHREPEGGYVDRAAELGVAGVSRQNAGCGPMPTSETCLVLSWSAALSDFDLDGYDELLLMNGETSPANPPPVLLFARGATSPYHEVSPELPCMNARGLVVTDLDADGDQDVVIAQQDGPLLVYENRGTPAPGRWLEVVLRGQPSNRDGVGALVTLRMSSGRTQTRPVGAGGVVHTASPAEAFFGLGSDAVDALEVRWPSGRRTEVTRPPTGRLVVEERP